MILSTNAYNWAMLRSGLSMGDFSASLTPEREAELFKQYNAWRRSRGLPEEKAPVPAPTIAAPAPVQEEKPAAPVDDLSALITEVAAEVAAEVEEEEAEEAALVQNALDGADEIVEEEAAAPVPDEIVEELEEEPAPEEADELVPEDAAPMDTEVGAAPEVVITPAAEDVADDDAAPEVATTPAVVVEPVVAEPAVDFTTTIRSLPKEPDPALYSRIKDQYGPETLPMVQAALKEATAKHRTTAAIRAFIAWLCKEIN